MTEQKYQAKIIKKLEAQGYYLIKIIKCNKNGIPDLIALKSGEGPIFIECKTQTGVLSEIQKYRLSELKKNGFKCYVSKKLELNEF
jgi:Holliday junction resolvase